MTKHEHEIKTLLYDLKITTEIKGFHYLIEAIVIKEQANKTKVFKPQMEIYRDIAEKYNTRPSNVERAIRHAIERSYSNQTPLFLTVFKPALSIHKDKITSSCFIAMAAEHLASLEAED